MKKQTTIILAVVLMIGLITASAAIGLINTEKTLDKKHLDIIKQKTNIDRVEIDISNPDCSDQYCLFKAYQKGVININFQIRTFYYNYEICADLQDDVCMEYQKIYYKDHEIRDLADEYIKSRLENWAVVLEERDIQSQNKSIGGELTITNKK